MPQVELDAGPIEYTDSGGTGPVLVFLHGAVMDNTVWRKVVAELADFRCIVPTLPLGAHRTPMAPDADLTITGMARIVAQFLERLDLDDVTLVNNDVGLSQILISEGLIDRIGRLVFTTCEAFDNYPPGLPGRLLGISAKQPGGLQMAFRLLMFRPARRLPMTWGHMSKRPVPDDVMDAWFKPILTSAEIRRDFKKYSKSIPKKKVLLEWAERVRSFDRPALVVWSSEGKMMPREHGRKLADMLPNGRLVEIDDAYVLVNEDQPKRLADEILAFVGS